MMRKVLIKCSLEEGVVLATSALAEEGVGKNASFGSFVEASQKKKKNHHTHTNNNEAKPSTRCMTTKESRVTLQ